jgi:hypothetical protein
MCNYTTELHILLALFAINLVATLVWLIKQIKKNK